tara:strand:- start:21 stop:1136 length:1116 start_codon:yes stop_codon:yes gene_type:complete
MGASLGFIPGFLATALSEDLDVSRGKIGLIVGIYFGATGIGSIPAGRLTDRFGARKVVVSNMLLVAGTSLLIAIFSTYLIWIVASVLAGMGYALANTGTNVAIGNAVPLNRRGLAMSVKVSGVPLMATVAAAIGPWAANVWNWETILVLNAISATIAGLIAYLILDDDRREAASSTTTHPLPRGFYWFGIAAFLLIGGSQPLYSWTVSYLEESLNTSAGLSGVIMAIASFTGVIVMICNGIWADKLGALKRIPLIMLLLTISSLAVIMVILGTTIGTFTVIIGLTIGISTQLASIGTMHAAIIDVAPLSIGRATGVTMTGYYLGALVTPAGFGLLVDITGTYLYSWLGTLAILTTAIAAWQRAGKIPTQLS